MKSRFALKALLAMAVVCAGAAASAETALESAAATGVSHWLGGDTELLAQAGGPMHMQGHGRMGGSPEMRARRMAVFKEKLGISAAQDPAWAEWMQAMQRQPLMTPDEREAMLKLPTPERIDRMQALGERMREAGAKRAAATKRFYAALNPDQQKLFDQITAQRMGRRMPMHGPRGEHRHG
ncbi:MAG: hypothetical protein EBU07_09895 [Betaproteobacteria bacterium]|nr:hypothetical protein [Betaproteobacteria bacterium]NBS46964.1 hypothetical protein [Betaproteobacteria bacterium]